MGCLPRWVFSVELQNRFVYSGFAAPPSGAGAAGSAGVVAAGSPAGGVVAGSPVADAAGGVAGGVETGAAGSPQPSIEMLRPATAAKVSNFRMALFPL